MKDVFIKYNPYKLETEITVDGAPLAENSRLRELIKGDCEDDEESPRLQYWAEDLPGILLEDYNDRDFNVLFHGTRPDYEDLKEVFDEAQEEGTLTAKLEHKPAKETADKKEKIRKVFARIRSEGCPFDDLRTDPNIQKTFEEALSEDFEVCVVATMSAGKSTLINAMLGKKLMPSKQEACTAIITRIEDEERDGFRAEIYDKSGGPMETIENLTYEDMKRLNEDERVSEIRAFGRIPFVAEEEGTRKKEIKLIMIDTPGPNNARNPEHKKTQRKMLEKNSKTLVLYIMTGEFGTEDDNNLIDYIAKSMAVKGKQSKDRFIFVVNKLDGRKKEDGSTEETLERVRDYLREHGIAKPNLFPAAALPALNIRLQEDEACEMDEDDRDETETKIRKLNRKEELHFERFAALPPGVKGDIEDKLAETRKNWQGDENENPAEALIHSGVVSIEAAINQYVYKYAKTAKIKNIVDTFMTRIEELDCEIKTVLAIANSKKEGARIAEAIEQIKGKLDSGEEARKFKARIDDTVKKTIKKSKADAEDIVLKFQKKLKQRIDRDRGERLSRREAEAEAETLRAFAARLEPDFNEDMQELLQDGLQETANELLKEYRRKVAALTDEVVSDKGGFKLEPLKLVGAALSKNFSVKELVREEEVAVGERWVEPEKHWYNPFSWFRSGHYETIYKTEKYVDGEELAQRFFTPVQESLYKAQDSALAYAEKQSKIIAQRFDEEVAKVDGIIKEKLSAMEALTADREKAAKEAEEAKEDAKWLEDIKGQVESILEI